jgi:hypothetical protein
VLDKIFKAVLILAFSGSVLQAQEIHVRGGFVQDHFEVGDNVDYWLSATYPSGVALILPDSLFDFGSFEFVGKNYYPSQIKMDQIYDTAVYTLQCYEIDPIQKLRLPAIVLANGDSSLFYSQTDSILFNQLVAQVSDTTRLKTNTSFVDVGGHFNFILLWIVVGSLIVLVTVGLLIFGKKILLSIKLRKLRKDYIRFSDELTGYIRSLKSEPERTTAELAISKWKQFAERLENKPYSKMTSKEILGFDYTRELADPLKNIDRFVYGGQTDESLYKQFHSIEDFTQHRYSVIVEEMKKTK